MNLTAPPIRGKYRTARTTGTPFELKRRSWAWKDSGGTFITVKEGHMLPATNSSTSDTELISCTLVKRPELILDHVTVEEG